MPAGTPDINDGELHHIVLVSAPENDEVRLYSDGELSSSNNAPAIQSNENPMMIGENPDARNRTWSGIIDDVGIWNRPLTEDEIVFLAGNSIAAGLGTQMKVGLNFGVDQGDSSVDADVAAGLEPQTNWNNLSGGSGDASDIVADDAGASVATDINVEWVSNNTWSSTGGGEENNEFEDGGDKVIFTGYLDTAAATTTAVTITGIPQELQDAGYSVVCYIMGGVPEKGGGYWVEDDAGNILTDVLIGDSNVGSSEYVQDPGVDHSDMGNYVILKGLSAANIVVKASTADGLGFAAEGRGAIRAPINAIQLVGVSGGGPRVVGKFSADWTDDVEPEGTYMAGVAEVGDEFLHITDAANGANGAFTIEDFSNGAVFTDFEMSFRLHMSDSTCCGGGDDNAADHRPADGMSISIGNDLPDTIGLAEEGSGSGIRICFDMWDSGGGEAPAIDVWRGAEGEVGDGDQGAWSGGMLVRQKFNGVTSATEEEKFKDANGDYVWLWTQGEWVDVKISVKDGMFTINYKGHEVISHALPAAWAPLVGPNWLFAARTGGANETHWIDDLNITLYGSTAPGVSMFESDAGGWRLKITDIEEAGVDLDSVVVTYEGEVIDLPATKTDGVTSIQYDAAEPLLANSDHTLQVAFKDSNGKNQLLNLDFSVKDFSLVDSTLRVPDSAKGDSGFLVYTTQISSGQGVGSIHGTNWAGAEKQIRGDYIDPDTEEVYLNEADLDSFDAWSYMPAWVEVVNQNQDAPAGIGNFQFNDKGDSSDREDEPIPGIPGWGDSTDGIASEYVTMLELSKGAYKFGVNSDDGFNASFGVSYPDAFQQSVGRFDGGRGSADSTFEIYVLEDGLYPFRVSWWEGGGGANIEIFSFVEIDGKATKVLINDPDVEGSIKAFAPKGVAVDETTSERATTGRAYIAGVFPGEGAFSTSKNVELTVVNGDVSSLDQGSVKVSFDGEVVTHKVKSDGDNRVISYDASSAANGKHTALVEFADSNGGTRSVEWAFTLADPIEEGQLNLLAHWGFDESLDASESIDSVNGLAAVFESNAKITAESIRGNALDTTAGGARALVAEGAFLNLASSINQVTYTFWLKWKGSRVASSAFWAYSPSSPSGRRGAQAHVPWGGGDIYWDTAGCCGGGDTRINKGWGGDYHTWNHFAFIKNEDLKQIFINGELFHEGENTNPLPMDFNQLHIMSGENGGNRTAGLMDDFAVFASALEPEQLVDVMSGKLLGAELSSDLIAVQPTDISAEMNQTATFSLELTSDEGVSVLWKMNGVNIGSGTSVETGLLTDEDDGAKIQATVMSSGSYQESTVVTLTVTPDKTAPAVVSSDGSRYMNTLKLVYSEEMDEGAVGSYTVAGLSVDSAELIGTNTVILSTDEQTPGKVYTVSVSGAKDPSGNAFNGDVTIQAYVESTGYLWWDYWGGIAGAHPMENLTDSENYPDNPDSSQLLPWTNSRWAVGFHNNAHENYGARASGWLVAPEDGEYRIWLRSDDHGQVWISLDEDPENVELIAEQVGCCNGFTLDDGGLSGIVELEEGQRYYFEALLKEGGGGDWMNVGWTRPSDADLDAPPWNDGGISGEHFVNYIPATGSTYTGDAEIYHAGTKAPESGGVGTNNGGGLLVREFQGIGGASLGDLLTNAKWPNSPDLVTWSNHAEWPQNESGDINDLPVGNVQDNYATQLLGFVHPPETGEYQFFLAADDSTALFLSTDETPDNKRLIAIEPNWNGVREFGQGRNRVVVDNDTGRKINGSAPISLEAGKAYFIEAITKEGGGGDNLAITWIRAGDDLPVDGALPISGDHLSPWLVEPPPPSAVDNGDGTITFETHLAWEWWDGIGGAHPMENLTDNARYPDSPDGATFAPSWNTRTALAGGFEGNGRENYGGRMSGVLTAPESGTYRFFIASDDHGLLRISTDADPANAVRVAEQTGCCNDFTLDDGGLSGTVDLVAGNQYYMESLLKEGGGGDWMTVGWRMPSEDIDSVPVGNQEGIPGTYFTGTVTVPALPALSSSLSVAAGNSMDPKATVTLNVTDGATTLDVASVTISLGGTALDSAGTEGTWSKQFSSVTQSGKTHSVSAVTGAIEAGTEYTVSATFKDSAGAETTHDATFTIPVWELYGLGTKAPATAAGSISVRQYQGVNGGFNDLMTSFKFPDSPDFEERVGYLEWPQTGDINTPPEGNVQDNYGVQLIGFLHPPETADYQFAIASDDNSQLWLSTDENPANRVLIAKETGWQPIRKYQAVGDEATSEFISLEAGKAYYIEILNKEGGGGDNVAVAWTTGDALVEGALPISGDYLSPWVPESQGPADITTPGDAIVPSSDNHPDGEHAGLAFDNNARTKYLNRDGANGQPSGLTITTGGGVVTGMSLTSANDAPDRDPSTFILSGSNDGGATFAEIASGDVPAFSHRYERVNVSFDNSVAYTTYEVTFPTAGGSTCCMQIAEIELLGTADGGGGGGDAPTLSIVNNGDGTVTVTFEGKLQAAPTVNGPWQDSGLTSPATINSDQAQQYGRAVRE
ncbi:PA14 domain-containing protein [bacterium]|nr:PA14 domain-containing protein [bacterium]